MAKFKRIGAIGVAKVGIRTLAAATLLAHGTDLQKEKERLAGDIPPPPPPPSPSPCSGTFRSWCSGDEGQYGAPVWPVVLWAQPASASITKTAASGVRQFLTLFGPPDTGVPIQCHSIGLDEAAYLPPAIRSAGLTARETNYSITSSARARIDCGMVKPSALAV